MALFPSRKKSGTKVIPGTGLFPKPKSKPRSKSTTSTKDGTDGYAKIPWPMRRDWPHNNYAQKAGGPVQVSAYTRDDGTHVRSYTRSLPRA